MFRSTSADENGGYHGQVQKSEAEWRDELTPEQFRVLRKHGTEPSHTSALNHVDELDRYP